MLSCRNQKRMACIQSNCKSVGCFRGRNIYSYLCPYFRQIPSSPLTILLVLLLLPLRAASQILSHTHLLTLSFFRLFFPFPMTSALLLVFFQRIFFPQENLVKKKLWIKILKSMIFGIILMKEKRKRIPKRRGWCTCVTFFPKDFFIELW